MTLKSMLLQRRLTRKNQNKGPNECPDIKKETEPVLELNVNELIPINAVNQHLPRQADGNPYHPSTATRWARYGMQGRKLKTVKLAGRRFTKEGWLAEFLEGWR